MINRFWRWLIGNQKVEIDINLKVKDLDKLMKVLSQSSSTPVIITNENKPGTTQALNENEPKRKKKLSEDPVTSKEVADIMLAQGIEKANDKTGNDIVSSSEGGSTDDTVSSLKKMFKGDPKDG